jgi:hypothetical protein
MLLITMIEGLTTQISSKYSPDNPGVFELRRKLMRAGINVVFPAGNSIIEYAQEFAITIPEEAIVPFHLTEAQFLSEIRKNHIQITYNIYGSREGYVGESTSIETAYALECNKPIYLMREMVFGSRVRPSISRILRKYRDAMYLEKLDQIEPMDIKEAILQKPLAIDYGLNSREKRTIYQEIQQLSKEYEVAWQRYQDSKK